MASGYKTHAKNYAKLLIGKFKCVKESTLARLMKSIDNVEYPETIIKDLLYNTSIKEKEYAGEKYLFRDVTIKYNENNVNCFEAFTDLLITLRGIEKKVGVEGPVWMDDAAYEKISRISEGTYPYDFVFSYNNDIYLMMNYGDNGNAKFQFHKRTIGKIVKDNSEMEDPVEYVFVPIRAVKKQSINLSKDPECPVLVADLKGKGAFCKFTKVEANG